MYAKKIKKIDGYSVFNYCILFFLLFMFWSFYLLGLTSYGLSGLVKNWNVNIFSALMTLALSAFIFFGVMDKSKQILPIKGLANTLMWILMFLVTMSAVSSGFIVAMQFPTNELALEIFGFKNSVLENIILFLNNGWVFILSALLSIWYYWTKRNVYVVQPGSIAATYKGEVKRAGENRDLGYVIQKLELMLWENDYFVLGSSVRWQGKVVKAEFEVSPKRFNKS